MPGGGGHSGSGRDRGGPGGASRSGPDRGGRDAGRGGSFSDAGYANRQQTGYSPGTRVGGYRSPPSGSGPVHYNEKFDTYVSRTPQAQKNLDQAVKDYNDRTIMEKIGSFLGIGQVDPTTDPNFNAAKHNAPQTSFDALGMGLGLAGLATGMPLGGIYDLTKAGYAQVTGTNPTFGEVNIGDFGQAPQTGYGSLPGVGQADSQTDPNESAFGGIFGGGGFGGSSPKGGQTDGKQGEGKDSGFWNLANALTSGTQPNPQPSGTVTPQPTTVPAIQVPQPPMPSGVPAQYANMNAPKMPVTNYPGMRWIGGGIGSRPLYG